MPWSVRRWPYHGYACHISMRKVTTLRVADDVKERFDALGRATRARDIRLSQSDLIDRLLRLASMHEDEFWSDGSWEPPSWSRIQAVLDRLPDTGPDTDAASESFA